VRVAFPRQALEEIPSAPQGANAQHPDDEASDEERRCEHREHLGRDNAGRERARSEAELSTLFLTKLPEASVSLVDRSCVHDLLLLAYYETIRCRIDVYICETVQVRKDSRRRSTTVCE
jgi:hypothetical protein